MRLVFAVLAAVLPCVSTGTRFLYVVRLRGRSREGTVAGGVAFDFSIIAGMSKIHSRTNVVGVGLRCSG